MNAWQPLHLTEQEVATIRLSPGIMLPLVLSEVLDVLVVEWMDG